MLTEILPFSFELDTIAIAGASLWSLALYLGFSRVSEWVIEQLNRWFNFAERYRFTPASQNLKRLAKPENPKTLFTPHCLASRLFW